jgi:hypothetical protein
MTMNHLESPTAAKPTTQQQRQGQDNAMHEQHGLTPCAGARQAGCAANTWVGTTHERIAQCPAIASC